jgi:hypothetical protein
VEGCLGRCRATPGATPRTLGGSHARTPSRPALSRGGRACGKARAEAEALLAKHGSSICVRLYQRADGTVLTADCPVGLRRTRVRRGVLAAAGAGALAAAASTTFATQGSPVAVTVGRVVVEPPVVGSGAVQPTATPKPPPAPPPNGKKGAPRAGG